MNSIILCSVLIISTITVISLLFKEIFPEKTTTVGSHYFYRFVSKFIDTRKLKLLSTCNQFRNYKKYNSGTKICTFVKFKKIKDNNEIIDDNELVDVHSILNFGNNLSDSDQSFLIKKFSHILGLDASTMLIRYISTIFGYNKNYKNFDNKIIITSFDNYVENDLKIINNNNIKKSGMASSFVSESVEKINLIREKLIIALSLIEKFNKIKNEGYMIIDNCIINFKDNDGIGEFINVQDIKNNTIDSFYYKDKLILFNFIINLIKLKDNHGFSYSLIDGKRNPNHIGRKLKIYHGFEIIEVFKMSKDHKVSMIEEHDQPKTSYYIQNNESGFTIILATIFMCLMSFSELYSGKTKEILVYISVAVLYLSCLFTMQKLYKFITVKKFIGIIMNNSPGWVSSFLYNNLPTFTPCNYKNFKILKVKKIFALNTTAMRNFKPTQNEIKVIHSFQSECNSGRLLIDMENSSILIERLKRKTGGKFSCRSYEEVDNYYKVTWSVFGKEVLSTNVSNKFINIINYYVNIILTLKNNEIDGISDGNEALGSNHIHFINPIEIFNELIKSYNSGEGLEIFSEWEVIGEIYCATTKGIKIEITKTEDELRKVSGLLEDKSYCFINYFRKEFFRGTDIKGLRGFEVIPGSIPKNKDCNISNKVLKRYMCDLSKLYEFLGYKKLRMVGKFNDSEALKKVIGIIKSKDVEIELKVDGNDELSKIGIEFEICKEDFHEKVSEGLEEVNKSIDKAKEIIKTIEDIKDLGIKTLECNRDLTNIKSSYINLREIELEDSVLLLKVNKSDGSDRTDFISHVDKEFQMNKLKLKKEITAKKMEIGNEINNCGLLSIRKKKDKNTFDKIVKTYETDKFFTSKFPNLEVMSRQKIENSILSKIQFKITDVVKPGEICVKENLENSKNDEDKKKTFKVDVELMAPISSFLKENEIKLKSTMKKIESKQSKVKLIKSEKIIVEKENIEEKNSGKGKGKNKSRKSKGLKFGTRSLIDYRVYYNSLKKRIWEIKGKSISCLNFPIFGKNRLGQKNFNENKIHSSILKKTLKETQFNIAKVCLDNFVKRGTDLGVDIENVVNSYIDKLIELSQYEFRISSEIIRNENLKDLKLMLTKSC